MNRPLPHIGRTLSQIDKAALLHRLNRQNNTLRQQQAAAAWHPEPCQFVAANDDADMSGWRDAARFWICAIAALAAWAGVFVVSCVVLGVNV